MSQATPLPTVEQYLEMERKAELRSEYLDGQVFAMSGGSLNHARIVRNTLSLFTERLRGSQCEAVGSDLRLFCARDRVFTYPDIVVMCGPHRFFDERHDTIADATLIVEVLSPSTMNYDRGEKFRYYRSLESFAEYLLLAQDTTRAEHHMRQSDGSWLFREYTTPGSEIRLSSIGCSLTLGSLYERVEFDTQP